ncbi:class I SAM-dependent methyltransferase [Xylophilus ampelinus]|uniref:Nodulation protein S (NodS) n=1 Tax=Xylophilus ampelinus TaxID=54067 RepID=A0A318SGU8_9BURK|nr:SAM-dependent methyltransferase [Xylophilus ampelinus]MCS4511694.1 nodulation S family protein [Xylophilus ampelinus]PYE73796.1 nodulation protein S (NodS) [Xylophilus ampelinus]
MNSAVIERSAETPDQVRTHFDALHRDRSDPWGVRSRWYERRKTGLIMAALPRERYASVFEPGCSIGGNSVALAGRCDRLVASDASAPAVERARHALASFPHVRVEQWYLPWQWPAQRSDLVVVSELAYYLDDDAFDRFLAWVPEALHEGGHLLMCHWRARIGDAHRSGDAVHGAALQQLHLLRVGGWQDDDMRIDVWQRGGDASVAAVGGAQEALAQEGASA